MYVLGISLFMDLFCLVSLVGGWRWGLGSDLVGRWLYMGVASTSLRSHPSEDRGWFRVCVAEIVFGKTHHLIFSAE